jgi:hypothetical protein
LAIAAQVMTGATVAGPAGRAVAMVVVALAVWIAVAVADEVKSSRTAAAETSGIHRRGLGVVWA